MNVALTGTDNMVLRVICVIGVVVCVCYQCYLVLSFGIMCYRGMNVASSNQCYHDCGLSVLSCVIMCYHVLSCVIMCYHVLSCVIVCYHGGCQPWYSFRP